MFHCARFACKPSFVIIDSLILTLKLTQHIEAAERYVPILGLLCEYRLKVFGCDVMAAVDHPRNKIDETQYRARIKCCSMLPKLNSPQEIVRILVSIPGQIIEIERAFLLGVVVEASHVFKSFRISYEF